MLLDFYRTLTTNPVIILGGGGVLRHEQVGDARRLAKGYNDEGFRFH